MALKTYTIVLSILLATSLVSGCSTHSVHSDKPANQTKNPARTSENVKTSPVKKRVVKTNDVIIKPVRIIKPKPRSVRKVVKKPPVRSVQRGSWGQQRANRLSGDFARNPQTLVFIDKMVNKHGFDRGHLNYLFSNTHATPFLQRMAYRDAYPVKKTKKNRKGSWTRYRNLFLTDRTINRGIQFWRENRAALQRAEQRYGVPQEYILGIIGIETRYGGNVGKNRAIDALANMGFSNVRRGKYFQKELESYLLMTRRTRLNPLQPKSSYAGALGLCQFMPSNIKRYGVDHDGSGSCNLWTPADAIGSIANYLRQHGWRTGGAVAVMATTEGRGYRNFKSSYKRKHSLAKMQRNGIYPVGPIDQSVRLLRMNTYSGDEVWLAGHNFYVITRYNHSSKYAMAVHQLAQEIKKRISGGRPLRMASIVLK